MIIQSDRHHTRIGTWHHAQRQLIAFVFVGSRRHLLGNVRVCGYLPAGLFQRVLMKTKPLFNGCLSLIEQIGNRSIGRFLSSIE